MQRLDYSHRDSETGKVNAMADSALKVFQTQKGRKVIDGRGIQPDVAFEDNSQSAFIKELGKKFIIFDFITQSVGDPTKANIDIDTTGNFNLNNEQWNQFIQFCKNNPVQLEPEEYQSLKLIKKSALEKKLLSADDFTSLENKLTQIEDSELKKWRTELEFVMELETVRRLKNERFYYKQLIKNDPLLIKAEEIFKNQYQKIVNP